MNSFAIFSASASGISLFLAKDELGMSKMKRINECCLLSTLHVRSEGSKLFQSLEYRNFIVARGGVRGVRPGSEISSSHLAVSVISGNLIALRGKIFTQKLSEENRKKLAWKLKFLYLGSANLEKDLKYYRDILGAKLIWHSKHFGAEVAAFSFSDRTPEDDQPLLLIADHLPSPKCELIYEVESLESVARDLRARGWKPEGEMFEIPNGPCYLFKDPSGNTLAIFENTRPDVMTGN